MNNKLLSRISLLVALALAISTAAGGQQTQTQIAPSVERLRTHINYLASDKLEGRRTGSEGANLAAEYIAKEFARYGIQRSIGWDTPGMSILEADSPNRYLQKFPYVAGVDLGKNNELALMFFPRKSDGLDEAMRLNYSAGADWMPLGFSSNAQLEGTAPVFVGYGITAAELNYDDYADNRAKDRVAVALSGTSDGESPHGQFARYEDARWKAIAARNAGARALVIIARESNFKDDRLARLRFDNSAGAAGIPVLAISQQLAPRLFGVDSI